MASCTVTYHDVDQWHRCLDHLIVIRKGMVPIYISCTYFGIEQFFCFVFRYHRHCRVNRPKLSSHPRKKTSMLAFLDVGLSSNPVPLVPRIPSGLPPTPDANFLPIRPEELLGRCWIGELYARDDVGVPLNCLCAGDGVPTETDRGESDRDEARRGEGWVPDGDALYRGGVIVSLIDVAIGVMSALSVFFRKWLYLSCLNRSSRVGLASEEYW